ncbi:IMP-specific 5'-nucleotidase (Isn1), putative [Talaromyces stipitatus ATCC 10500]|uniref:IMP-specific 5'-nucleotidase 1 n=1 Tax=Talaromyces stipitatus (strain ATCC 10500 / CBS 375.48 / QM 6759 / NRRL 1006) TaxID=441959 RepID=B8MP78_TALSN|nr:IMP-specific 5'-nucleotidase (Isn1), putative [Talaromyces stipitatus ATCC 10500]EED14317.1 IMP-specific 5'-nucleotidase (Isn1), putative [Talaromyces stipitatus ATCC 10500]
MTTRYRVEYALKTHRRDQLIEWIKGLLAVPFVLHSQPTVVFHEESIRLAAVATATQQRYAEIMRDVELLIKDHINHNNRSLPGKSKLKLLVPTVGHFFTPLLLEDAFIYQDQRRHISRRRFVAPSFNDVRLTLNTAQLMGLVRSSAIRLLTFDGDVTLYEDGCCLDGDNPVLSRLLRLLSQGKKIGIVTAAGYTEPSHYYLRLKGLLDAVKADTSLTPDQKSGLIVMGGESNFLFRYDQSSPHLLSFVPRSEWMLDEMHTWNDKDIDELLNVAEASLRECVSNLSLPANVLRKSRAVGIYPVKGKKMHREQLEETVLVVQNMVERSEVGKKLPFCAFNGGNDVFIDIGDKSWGVRACQRYFGGIDRSTTLHVGDQFLSAGANDFKARTACTTAWIANPAETVQLLDEMFELESEYSKGE